MESRFEREAIAAEDKLQKGPQPNWVVLQILNVVVVLLFIGSIFYVALNYREVVDRGSNKSPLTTMFFPMIVLWTLCLAYFFGFFGISFVDKDALKESPSTFGLDDIQSQIEASERAERIEKERQAKREREIINERAKHMQQRLQPRHDAPICAEIKASANKNTHTNAIPATNDSEDYTTVSDEDVLAALSDGRLKDHLLEKKLGDYERAVGVRRMLYDQLLTDNNNNNDNSEEEKKESPLRLVPYAGYDYGKVFGANCEIVVGYVPIPLGLVGPLVLNGEAVYVPMATTEGCLVASTNRGCKAITASGGCCAVVLKDAITRAPCVRFPSAMRAAALKAWLNEAENLAAVAAAFNSTTSYGRLESVEATVAGRNVYLRFACMSGDAMGMNMVSKGCLKAIELLEQHFPDLTLVAISGNMCTDKKPAAINWILGRGKSIVVEAVIPESIVTNVLKCSVAAMIDTNRQKNLIGSAMAGSIGGFNAHAANVVTAVYLATGQDPAQNVESSNCLTLMELAEDGRSLHVSVTMPSVEVGTVGGGTHLPAQAGCLEICGVRGASKQAGSKPGDNSRKLATIVGGAVLAGELSLMAALAANHLVQSHMTHNRKTTPSAAPTAAVAPVATETAGVVSSGVRHSTSMVTLSSAN